MIVMEENIRPPFFADNAARILQTFYRRHADEIIELSSELDRNFQIQSGAETVILKFAHPGISDAVLDLQNSALKHLAQQIDFCPHLIPTKDGADMAQAVADGRSYSVRLFSYMPGMRLADVYPHAPALLYELGNKLGQVSAALTSLDHAEKRPTFRWNLTNLPDVVAYAEQMPADKKALVTHFNQRYLDNAAQIKSLRQSFVHNDPNDYNVLVEIENIDRITITGLIDFGDMSYGPTVADLAVALAYIMMDKSHPLRAAEAVIAGYHAAFPLTADDLKALYDLIAARLCLSVCISWVQQAREPDNGHLSTHEQSAWDLLQIWREVDPRFAHYHFRVACGLPPVPHTEAMTTWFKANQANFYPILGTALQADDLQILDLSVGSLELGAVSDFADTARFTQLLFQRLNGKIGIGCYDEARPIYLGDGYTEQSHERRTVHIGVDLFAPAGTPIFAPLDGHIFSVEDNGPDKDYGPTILLRHQPADAPVFYTLYGHLGHECLEQWHAGDPVQAGTQLATMGTFPANGDWPPHVHFQIITDLLGQSGDYPGVVAPQERPVWLSICPDPNLILNLPHDVVASQGLSKQTIVQNRKERLNPALSISYQEPLKIVRGYMHHLYDEDGQVYLDCVNNVPHVGHSHPRVVEVAQQQMAILNTNTRYLHDTILAYAERIAAKFPDPLSVVFFTNSGSEANELALRLARTYTGKRGLVVVDHSYHGNTNALIEISPYKYDGPGGQGQPGHVEKIPVPDGYRGEFWGFDETIGQQYAEYAQRAIETLKERGYDLAGFISEAIISGGGQVVAPEGYLEAVYQHIRAAGGLCIADEVQIGFGRVGSHFWGFETQNVVPDIVTMGKPIGNGHPLAAVVTTPEIAAAFHNGMEYFNTFSGSPVSCAIGLEVLNVIEEESLQQNALEVGDYFQEQLRDLQERYPLIGQVRGKGLFLGVELVRDQETLEAADTETRYIIEQMKNRGILISSEGPLHNVLKIKPPIIFKKTHVDQFITALDDTLGHAVLTQP